MTTKEVSGTMIKELAIWNYKSFMEAVLPLSRVTFLITRLWNEASRSGRIALMFVGIITSGSEGN